MPKPPRTPKLPRVPKSITDLKVVRWAIEKLLPYARNARTHTDEQIAQVAASIIEFGWTNPILVGADGVVIAGHARLAAARKLKMTEVPVIVLDHLTPTQRRALVLADNRLALSAGWDEEMLRVELESLEEDGFDLDLVGFTDDELEELLRDPEETREGLTDDDAVPEEPERAVTVVGDVWVMGDHRLLCGDATSIEAVQAVLTGNLADMVFTDPPYNVDHQGRHLRLHVVVGTAHALPGVHGCRRPLVHVRDLGQAPFHTGPVGLPADVRADPLWLAQRNGSLLVRRAGPGRRVVHQAAYGEPGAPDHEACGIGGARPPEQQQVARHDS